MYQKVLCVICSLTIEDAVLSLDLPKRVARGGRRQGPRFVLVHHPYPEVNCTSVTTRILSK